MAADADFPRVVYDVKLDSPVISQSEYLRYQLFIFHSLHVRKNLFNVSLAMKRRSGCRDGNAVGFVG